MGTMEWMHVPQGEFDLARFPADEKDPLRAWNAADEYLLTEVANVTPGGSVVLLNDSWGALAVALAGPNLHSISDSYVAQLATRANLTRNEVRKLCPSLVSYAGVSVRIRVFLGCRSTSAGP